MKAAAGRAGGGGARGIAIIGEFLPRQMSEEETGAAARAAVAELGAGSMKDMGKVMAVLKERYAGRWIWARPALWSGNC